MFGGLGRVGSDNLLDTVVGVDTNRNRARVEEQQHVRLRILKQTLESIPFQYCGLVFRGASQVRKRNKSAVDRIDLPGPVDLAIGT